MKSAKHSEIRATKLRFLSTKSPSKSVKKALCGVALTAESLRVSLLRAPMSSPTFHLKSKTRT